MASPVIYEAIAARMAPSHPSGCCEAHWERFGKSVPAYRNDLCKACFSDGDKPRKRRSTRLDGKPIMDRRLLTRRTVHEILRDKAAGIKECSHCHNKKELFLFPKRSTSKDGRMSVCQMCWNEYQRKAWKTRAAERKGL